jgi:hypothetical protein
VTDCYNPFAVQVVAGPGVVISQVALAIAAERRWLRFSDEVAAHLPAPNDGASASATGAEGSSHAPRTEAACAASPPCWETVARAAAIPAERLTVQQLAAWPSAALSTSSSSSPPLCRQPPRAINHTHLAMNVDNGLGVWQRAVAQLLEAVDPAGREVAAIVAAELCAPLGIGRGLRHVREARLAGAAAPPARPAEAIHTTGGGAGHRPPPPPPPQSTGADWFPVAPAVHVPEYKLQLLLLLQRLRSGGRDSGGGGAVAEAAGELAAARARRSAPPSPAAAAAAEARRESPSRRASKAAAAAAALEEGWLANSRSLGRVASMLSMLPSAGPGPGPGQGQPQPADSSRRRRGSSSILSAAGAAQLAEVIGAPLAGGDDASGGGGGGGSSLEGWEGGSPLSGLCAEAGGGADGFIGWHSALQLGVAVALVGNHPMPRTLASHPLRRLIRAVREAAAAAAAAT